MYVHAHTNTSPTQSPQTGTQSGGSRVESAGGTETLWPFNSKNLWTGQDHTHTRTHTKHTDTDSNTHKHAHIEFKSVQ